MGGYNTHVRRGSLLQSDSAQRLHGSLAQQLAGSLTVQHVAEGSEETSNAARGSHEAVSQLTQAIDGKICLPLLHAGRYAYHPLSVSASKQKAPINPFTPRALSARGVSIVVFGLMARALA